MVRRNDIQCPNTLCWGIVGRFISGITDGEVYGVLAPLVCRIHFCCCCALLDVHFCGVVAVIVRFVVFGAARTPVNEIRVFACNRSVILDRFGDSLASSRTRYCQWPDFRAK